MSTTEPQPFPPCPHCGGAWMRDLTWKHVPATCPLYEADTATAAADYDRRRGVRPMTETEAELTAGEFEDPPEGWALAVRFSHEGVHRRYVVEAPEQGGPLFAPATRTTQKETTHEH